MLVSSQSESIEDSVINEVLPLWKNQEILRNKIGKCFGGNLLLDWIGYIVELNLKSEIIVSSQKRIPELKKMIKQQTKTLAGLLSENKKIEGIVDQAKIGLNFQDLEFEDCSEVNYGSKSHIYQKSVNDDRFIFTSTVHRGTASGGIMQKAARGTMRKPEASSVFPNFNSDNLYGELSVYKHSEADEEIIYEGRNEVIGCCRMKFFCF